MKYLFEDWNELKSDLTRKSIALFLDYDGTLTPITKTPDKAMLSFRTKKMLRDLIKNPNCKLAIISGRSLQNIKKMVGIVGIIYVGSHGLEIEGPQIKFESPVSLSYKVILEHIKNELSRNLSSFNGVFAEDKGLTLSIHYRLVDRKQIPQVKTLFHEATFLYTVRNKIRTSSGKKVFEIRPPLEWDKGRVTLWLLRRWKLSLKGKNIVPFYIGDDVADEDAFKALRNTGITIFVGKPKRSYAQYYLKDTEEVKKFLSQIVDLATKGQ